LCIRSKGGRNKSSSVFLFFVLGSPETHSFCCPEINSNTVSYSLRLCHHVLPWCSSNLIFVRCRFSSSILV
jgi:hypothetical protein